MMHVKIAAAALPPVRPNELGQTLFDRFQAEPATNLIAVVDDDNRPVGLLERHSFFQRLASQYGRSLYTQRPIHLVMDDDPILVEADQTIAQFTTLSLHDRAVDLMRGFIVVDQGRYYGVGTPLSLLEAANQQNLRAAEDLRSLTHSLGQAKAAAERDKLFNDSIIENIPAMLFVKDTQNRFVLANRAAEQALGIPREHLLGRQVHEVFRPEEAEIFDAQDSAAFSSGEVLSIGEAPMRRPDGSVRVLLTRKLAVPDETGTARHMLVMSEDITERKRAESHIERLANHDALTDLANRVMLNRELKAKLALAARRGELAAVLCIDLDHFKTVNDTLGHGAGDELLKAFAERLRGCARSGDIVARLGGDEFAVLQTGIGSQHAAELLAERIVKAAEATFSLAGREVNIGASVGVALFPRDGGSGGELLKRADMALYCAKADRRGSYRVFGQEMDDQLKARRSLELDLRRALAQNEFELHYQPLYDLGRDRISGCEALLRWRHPKRGLIAPSDFIPAAEDIGVIAQLGEWVLRTACREAAGWPGAMKVAVNVSPMQFRSRKLVQTVAEALEAAGLEAGRLELEITENVFLGKDAANLKILHALRALGCRIALDDFGTGYSSLSYLRNFPFDKIKIDRCFVQDLPAASDSVAIVRAVTGLSASLGMTTTAEGVETPEQLEQLREFGCSEVQGYLIGRPYPAADLRAILALDQPLKAVAA
jgi:diguanylate cyclase (GGDEF)-like protein/PAS domain S-box-containing protein